MAIYHLSVKIMSRGKGKSAVAAAAYRSGEKIMNEYDGIIHDYTRKGGVVHTEILLPDNAPIEYSDRSTLWNAVEKIEKAANSQLAREIELALPVELTQEQNISLVCDYVKSQFVSAGMCADVCVHDKNDGNPHAHVLLTMRPFEQDGTWGMKERKEYAYDENGDRIPIIDPATGNQKVDSHNRKQWKRDYVQTNDWNNPAKAEEWRAAWAESVNKVLEQCGHESRVDHRSYERQGIEQIPTIHMGVAATQMEQKGIATECGNQNREITHTNGILFALLAKLKQLKDWLKEALTPQAPPTLVSILQNCLENGGQNTQYQIRNLKAAERVYSFMQDNGISKMSELRDKMQETVGKYSSAHDNLKYYDERIKTLESHITQGTVYLKHKDVYAEYKALKPRKQEKFYEAHRAELMPFEAAQRYFKEHHVKSDFSVNDWKHERVDLITGRGKIYREYVTSKNLFDEAYSMHHDAEQIVREIDAQNRSQPRDSRLKEKER